MSDHPVNHEQEPGNRRSYVWPWFVLAAVLVGIVLAVLWLSAEIERTRRIRDANKAVGAAQP
jgi:hypothetical protein